MEMEGADVSGGSAVVVGTWAFAKQAVVCARRDFLGGNGSSSLLDIVESSVNAVEDDPRTGVYIVGRGSYRNANGKHQFDAAIMEGETLQFGGVCALEGCPRPISVARRVLESTPHGMLVGDGAGEFARSHGFPCVTEEDLDPPLSASNSDDHQHNASEVCTESDTPDKVDGSVSAEHNAAVSGKPNTVHDTLGVIVRDRHGHVACGVSTSGPPMKTSGRVGDSALPGCGLYADDTVGAAVVSGDGDTLLRFCPAHSIINCMRQGLSASDACRRVASDITQRLGGAHIEMAFLAVKADSGEVGAATTVEEWKDVRSGQVYPGFPYARWSGSELHRSDVEVVVEKAITAGRDAS